MSDHAMPSLLPGPPVTAQGLRLPDPLPAGIMPPENSRMWSFNPNAVTQGEAYIKDDTREWFEQRDRRVVICRDYPDHPRWLVDGSKSIRAKLLNGNIVAEVHMLARLNAGLTDVPDWVPARMSVKQQQADLGFRLVKITRDVFRKKGKDAMETFADKAPGQFIKFIGATFIPKQLETTLNTNPNELPKERVAEFLDLIDDELARRAEEAKLVTAFPLDYEAPIDAHEAVAQMGQDLIDAAAATGVAWHASQPGDPIAARNLKQVVDIITPTDGWDDPLEGETDGAGDGW